MLARPLPAERIKNITGNTAMAVAERILITFYTYETPQEKISDE